jgi:hypothetical protein
MIYNENIPVMNKRNVVLEIITSVSFPGFLSLHSQLVIDVD